MQTYYFNRNGDSNKVHEVHTYPNKCPKPPAQDNREHLNTCNNCWAAVGKAQLWLNENENKHNSKNGYHIADGCKFCCPDCHTR